MMPAAVSIFAAFSCSTCTSYHSCVPTQLEVARMDDAAPILLGELHQVMAACYRPLLLYCAVSDKYRRQLPYTI
jgi:hypothetical protein